MPGGQKCFLGWGILTVAGALLARTKTGKGAYLDVSLSESMLAWQVLGMTAASSGGGQAPERGANLINGGAACYQVYGTEDGRFATLGALEAHFWANFCHAVCRDDWLSRQHETLPQTALIGEVAAMFEGKPLDHWEKLLGDVDCCYYAVLDYAEAAADPHVAARGLMTGGVHDGETWTGVLFPAHVDGKGPKDRPSVSEIDVETAVSRWRK